MFLIILYYLVLYVFQQAKAKKIVNSNMQKMLRTITHI